MGVLPLAEEKHSVGFLSNFTQGTSNMKSNLEKFAESVVMEAYGVDALTEEKLGVDIDQILKLVELVASVVAQIMESCPDKKNLANSLQKPSFLQRVRFRSALKSVIDSSGQLKLKAMTGKVADACFNIVSQTTPDVVNNAIEEILDPENAII